MAFSLIRNSRVFFTTNVASGTGVVAASGFTDANTFEIQVLDGFSFSQNTTADTVTLNEAGLNPVRGQRSFNTALEAVDFSFSTYMRPADAGTNIDAEEGVLWNALFTGSGQSDAWTPGLTKASISPTASNKHQLKKFGLIIVLDDTAYVIDNCALEGATIDFGLDAIATIAWTGKGTTLRQANVTANTATPVVFGGDLDGSAKAKNTLAPYIANKLSTMTLFKDIGGSTTEYTVALTGGSLSIANNLTYLTPANLGVVNTPVTYFTGTRAVSGSINAYLRSDAGGTGQLLSDMLAGAASNVDPAFNMTINVGGANATKVVFKMPACVLTIPSIATEQVVSTTINFTAQGSTAGEFDIAAANEVTVEYYTTNV